MNSLNLTKQYMDKYLLSIDQKGRVNTLFMNLNNKNKTKLRLLLIKDIPYEIINLIDKHKSIEYFIEIRELYSNSKKTKTTEHVLLSNITGYNEIMFHENKTGDYSYMCNKKTRVSVDDYILSDTHTLKNRINKSINEFNNIFNKFELRYKTYQKFMHKIKSMNKPIDSSNFWNCTKAIYKEVESPNKLPDYISEEGSRYWYTSNGVYRESDHWGQAQSCWWLLKSDSDKSKLDLLKNKGDMRRTGFCEFNKFKKLDSVAKPHNEEHIITLLNNEYKYLWFNEIRSHTLNEFAKIINKHMR